MPEELQNTNMPVDNSAELEAIIAQNEARGEAINTTNDILEASLVQNSKNTEDLKEKIDESGSKVAEAVKELKPEMQKMGKAANFVLGFLEEIKGDKGEDGYTPVKGKDYYTKEEIADVIKEIQDSIRIPEDGIDGYTPVKGEDYFTDEDISLMVEDVLSKIRQPEDGKDAIVDYEKVISECIARIPKPKNGKNGKDGNEITTEQILDKIRGVLSYNDLKDLPAIWKQVASRDYDLTELKDVSITSPSNGQVLKYNSTTRKWENGTDTGGFPGGNDTEVQFNDGGAFGGDAGLTYNKTTDTLSVGVGAGILQTHSVKSDASDGLLIEANNGTDVAVLGAGNTANALFYGGVNVTGNLAVDTNTLVVDTTNSRTGLLTTAPTHTLTLGSIATGIALYNTADQVTNYERGVLHWSSNILILRAEKAGSGGNRNIQLKTSSRTVQLSDAGSGNDDNGFLSIGNSTSSAVNQFGIGGTYTNPSGVAGGLSIGFTANQSGTAGYNGLKINITETATGSGTKRLISAQVGSVDKFVVDNAGNTTVVGNIIATKQIYYASEIDNGNSGASDTIDWTLGNIQKTTITADCTYTFTAPTGPGHYTLRIIQDGTGNWTATLPSGKWTSGIVPLIKDTASKWTILNIYYDGSAYSYSLNANLS